MTHFNNRANNSSIMHKLSEKDALDERNTYLDTKNSLQKMEY